MFATVILEYKTLNSFCLSIDYMCSTLSAKYSANDSFEFIFSF